MSGLLRGLLASAVRTPSPAAPPPQPKANRAERPRRDVGVPLLSLVSDADVAQAQNLITLHAPRDLTHTYCLTCATIWPCFEVRYARAITAGQAVWGADSE